MDLNPHPPLHAGPSRHEARPLYLMHKPSPANAQAIDRRRRALGLDSSYGRERYHITLLPLGDYRHLSAAELALLDQALASFRAEPFDLGFDRLQGNALVGGRAMRALREFQKRLADWLVVSGFPVPDYEFNPHLSLAYGNWQPRNVRIPPIAWRVEARASGATSG